MQESGCLGKFDSARKNLMIQGMEWAKPEYSKGKVDKAAKVLMHGDYEEEFNQALHIINNWRAVHNYPLNTFKVTLRKYASDIDRNCLVAQRIKRLSSIFHKFDRYPTLRLSQMQDIGGCRAILADIRAVHSLVRRYEQSDIKHVLDDKDDYIARPKDSGYRGIHLIGAYILN